MPQYIGTEEGKFFQERSYLLIGTAHLLLVSSVYYVIISPLLMILGIFLLLLNTK